MEPSAVLVTHLLPAERRSLVQLLASAIADEMAWSTTTERLGWSVKDMAMHLLVNDVSLLSGLRDDFKAPSELGSQQAVLSFIDELNSAWTEAARRTSPRLLCELLAFTGDLTYRYHSGLDPFAPGEPISWTGPDPAPNWLATAYEYAERWTHQQEIRDALSSPGMKEPKFLGPALAALMQAVPRSLDSADVAVGTSVEIWVVGRAGGQWAASREAHGWVLYQGASARPASRVSLDEEHAWRLLTNSRRRAEARAAASVSGDQDLGLRVLDTVSIAG
jgi:hypothetical protein